MKIQRFFAATAREALTQVRESLGPDAIILSNRNVDDGVEILASHESDLSSAVEQTQMAAPNYSAKPNPDKPTASNQPTPTTAKHPDTTDQTISNSDLSLIMNEIRAMRGSLETQLSTLTWNEQQQRHPAKSGILRELLAMGFSTSLCRYLAENAPKDNDVELGLNWAKSTLSRNLSVVKDDAEILDQGGVYALVGQQG